MTRSTRTINRYHKQHIHRSINVSRHATVIRPKVSRVSIILAIIAFLLLIIPAAVSHWKTEPLQKPEAPADFSVENYATLFNAYRQDNGLPALIFTDELNRIAILRLEEIKVNFSHVSEGNYNQYLGENIAMGSMTNKSAFETWRHSKGHNVNMLKTSYLYTGYAANDRYAVQVFR